MRKSVAPGSAAALGFPCESRELGLLLFYYTASHAAERLTMQRYIVLPLLCPAWQSHAGPPSTWEPFYSFQALLRRSWVFRPWAESVNPKSVPWLPVPTAFWWPSSEQRLFVVAKVCLTGAHTH